MTANSKYWRKILGCVPSALVFRVTLLTYISVQREPPPEVEWWDASLLPNKTYADLDLGLENLKIRTTDSPITEYIQHPIPIPAPWDKNAVPLKPLKLTKKVSRPRFQNVKIYADKGRFG